MLKLKLQYFGHLMWRADSEKTLMLGKTEGRRRTERQRTMWLDSIIDSMDMNLNELWEMAEDKGAWRGIVHGVKKSWTWLSNWTTATTMWVIILLLLFLSISLIVEGVCDQVEKAEDSCRNGQSFLIPQTSVTLPLKWSYDYTYLLRLMLKLEEIQRMLTNLLWTR